MTYTSSVFVYSKATYCGYVSLVISKSERSESSKSSMLVVIEVKADRDVAVGIGKELRHGTYNPV